VTGVVIGGATLAFRYAQKKLEAWGQQEAMDFIERARRQQHFEAMDTACNSTISSLVPTVFESIQKIADCEKHVVAIQTTKTSKLQIWEVLKIEVVSRVLLEMCSGAMLVILMKIQLNIIGASMLKENQYSTELQKKYLTMCNNFISSKMKDLYTVIRGCVDAVIHDVPLTQQMTVASTEDTLWLVYNRLRTEKKNPFDNMSEYLIPPESWENSREDSLANVDIQHLRSLIDDTRDLLESMEVKKLMNLLTSQGCGFFTDKFLSAFPVGNGAGRIPSDEEVWSFSNFGPVPLARLVSNIQATTKNLDVFTSWVNHLLNNDTFKMFGANIYEAFSCPK